MNPRQRRGVLLIGIAFVGAAAVFVAVVRYVADVREQLGPTVAVLQLAEAVPAFTSIAPDAVSIAEIPQRWAPERALRSTNDLTSFVASTDLPAGAVLQEGMVVQRPQIEPGQRELAILVNAETAVAGKVRPGDRVDVFATFPGTNDEPPSARIVLQNVLVVEVGNPVTTPDPSEAFGQENVVPVTFALDVDESRVLAYVESFASAVRLALRSPTDTEELPDSETVYAPAFGARSQTAGGSE